MIQKLNPYPNGKLQSVHLPLSSTIQCNHASALFCKENFLTKYFFTNFYFPYSAVDLHFTLILKDKQVPNKSAHLHKL